MNHHPYKDVLLINKTKKVSLNLGSRTASFVIGGDRVQTVRLGSREIETLRFMLNNQGRVISRDEILSTVWGERIVCENTVSVTLSNIRKILRKADEDCSCLISVSSSGYIFRPEKSGFTIVQSC
ncbi:TPA: transcriptional regulator [Enterobacter roggenkampii]